MRDNLRWWLLERLTRGSEQEVRLALPEHHGEVLQTALLALPDLAHLHLDVRLRPLPTVVSRSPGRAWQTHAAPRFVGMLAAECGKLLFMHEVSDGAQRSTGDPGHLHITLFLTAYREQLQYERLFS